MTPAELMKLADAYDAACANYHNTGNYEAVETTRAALADREADLTNRLAFQLKVSEGLFATIRRLEDEIAQTSTLHAWCIQGSAIMWKGEYAEIDAQAEARRCGGTCVAYPVFTKGLK